MVALGVAFAQLLDEFDNRQKSFYGHSPFLFEERRYSYTSPSELYRNVEDKKIRESFDAAFSLIRSLQQVLKIMSLGIDYRRYAHFRTLTPQVLWNSTSKKYVVTPIYEHGLGPGLTPIGKSPSIHDFNFCYEFMIVTAFRLQELDHR